MNQKIILTTICLLLFIASSCSKKDDTSAVDEQNTIVENQKHAALKKLKEEDEAEEVPETEIGRLIYKRYKDLRLVGYREGNFTNSGEKEILAYYNSIGINKESEEYDVAGILYVFIIKDKKLIKEYECGGGNCLSYDFNRGNDILSTREIVEYEKLKFGKWDEYTYVYDYNENGRDEILFFVSWSEGFVPVILEFHDGKMKEVLDITDKGNNYNNQRGFVETISDGKEKFLEIYDAYNRSKYESVRWEKYKWYEKEQMYLLYETASKPVFEKEGGAKDSKEFQLNDELKMYEVVIDLWYSKSLVNERKIIRHYGDKRKLVPDDYLFFGAFGNKDDKFLMYLFEDYLSFEIKSISGKYPDIVFHLNGFHVTDTAALIHEENYDSKVIMHFVDKNTVWFENDMGPYLTEYVEGTTKWCNFRFSKKNLYVRAETIK